MKIVVSPDSFKGSLSSTEVAAAIESGIRKVVNDCEVIKVPLGDGGEGTVDSLVAATNGKKVEVQVTGPLGTGVNASYGWLGDMKTCVIEMAEASGLNLVPLDQRNPMVTTTFGTGQLIKHALDNGCRNFILAVGGSATNDGGAGMLQALGLTLLDSSGNEIGYGGQELIKISKIDDHAFDPRIKESQFLIASDVQNPFIGKHGASHVFGPQKGATPEMVETLDRYLTHWADLIQQYNGISIHQLPGAGAAGGIGGAFQAFFPSSMRRGIDIVIEYTGLADKMENSDLVFTGEGQIDFQTASGKTPMGVAQEAQKLGIPTIVLAGSIGKGIDVLYQYGITSIHSIVNKPMSLEEAMTNARELIEQAAEQTIRVFIQNYNK